MKKSLFEQMGGTYTQVGDCLLPDLALPNEEEQSVGLWGQRHLRYIKQHKKVLYINLLTSGKLCDNLNNINEQAEYIFQYLVKQLAEREGITEKLKAKDQMEWVQRMNSVRNRALEIVNTDIIYM